MREIDVSVIREAVAELCCEANLKLPCMMREKIESCIPLEESPVCKEVLGDIVSNIDCADEHLIC